MFNSFISLLSKLSPLSSFISSSLGISSIFISLISRVSFLIESFGSEIPRTSSISTSFNSSISSFGLSSNFPYVSPIFGESSNFSFFLFIFFNTISKYPSIKFKPPAIVFTNLLYDSGGSFFPLSSIIAISFVIISLLSSCSSFGFNIFFPRNSLLCGFPSFISSSSSDSFFFFGNIFLNFISFSLLLLLSWGSFSFSCSCSWSCSLKNKSFIEGVWILSISFGEIGVSSFCTDCISFSWFSCFSSSIFGSKESSFLSNFSSFSSFCSVSGFLSPIASPFAIFFTNLS